MCPLLNPYRPIRIGSTKGLALFSCLFFPGLLIPFFSIAQTSLTDTLSTQDLGYYLVQAFNADQSTDRQPINHLGIEGTKVTKGIMVTGVLEGYPAHAVGIRRGDTILSVNDEPFHPVLTLNPEARREIFKPDLDPINLSYVRNNTIQTTRLNAVFENLFDSYRTATRNSVLEFNSGNKVIGYIRLWAISRSTHDLNTFREILTSLDHCDGIILDLRSGYGFIDHIHFSSFLSEDELRSILSKSSQIESLASSTYRKPLGILIDSQTSGRNEFFASALAQLSRTVVIGDTSAGKFGTFQKNKRNSRADDTVKFLYKPQANAEQYKFAIEGQGLVPDQKVLFPFNKNIAGDLQFDAAVLTLLGTI